MSEREAELETARRIRAIRLSKNQTQQEVADALGMRRTSYVHMENGKRKAMALEVAMLCEMWQVPHSGLFIDGMGAGEGTEVEVVNERWWYVRQLGGKYVVKSEIFVRHDDRHIFKASGAKCKRNGWRDWFPSREEAMSKYLENLDRSVEYSRLTTERLVKEREEFADFVAEGGGS